MSSSQQIRGFTPTKNHPLFRQIRDYAQVARLTRIHLSLAKATEIILRNKFVYRACNLMYYFMGPCFLDT